MTDKERNDLQLIIAQALTDMKAEQGNSFDINKVNLAELGRRTGISRKRLRKLKNDGFVVKPHALKGTHKEHTVLSGYTGVINANLQKGITNSSTVLAQLKAQGYQESQTQVRKYMRDHADLVPAPRQTVSSQGNRGRRYYSRPGSVLQMDWGFVRVEQDLDCSYRAACFAMICHHCGQRYIEFFPNARQENLFIGMIHGFQYLGIPKYVLTDNMKSVVTGRSSDGKPLWNHEYADFMKAVGFETKLCKPRHPFTKGAVERLIQLVKKQLHGRADLQQHHGAQLRGPAMVPQSEFLLP